jgi:hypothetical protein
MSRPSWIPPDASIHEVSAHAGQAALRSIIETIDSRRPLPLDFILTSIPSPELAAAAHAETIPLIQLP